MGNSREQGTLLNFSVPMMLHAKYQFILSLKFMRRFLKKIAIYPYIKYVPLGQGSFETPETCFKQISISRL